MDEKEETKVIRKKATLACDSCRKYYSIIDNHYSRKKINIMWK